MGTKSINERVKGLGYRNKRKKKGLKSLPCAIQCSDRFFAGTIVFRKGLLRLSKFSGNTGRGGFESLCAFVLGVLCSALKSQPFPAWPAREKQRLGVPQGKLRGRGDVKSCDKIPQERAGKFSSTAHGHEEKITKNRPAAMTPLEH